MGIYNRMSDVRTLKAELTSQLSSVHQAKMGAEYRSTKIKFNDITVLQAHTRAMHLLFYSLRIIQSTTPSNLWIHSH